MSDTIDLTLATRYLQWLDPGAARTRCFTYQSFHDVAADQDEDESLARVIPGPARDLLLDLHSRGAGIFVTVNETDGTGRKKENIKRVRAVWREADDPDLPPLPIEPSMVIETSPGHAHEYFLVADDWPADEKGRADFAAVMARMVETYGSCKGAKDLPRVLRIPGFLHRKYEPRLIRIRKPNGGGEEPRRYTRAEILAAFPPIERPRKEGKPQQHAWTPNEQDDLAHARDALEYVSAEDRETWLDVGMALNDHFGDAGRALWDEWSSGSDKYEPRGQDKAWRGFGRRPGITIATLFYHAKQRGWRARRRFNGSSQQQSAKPESAPGAQEEAASAGVSLDNFHAYMEQHNYIYVPTRAPWPASSVNARLGSQPVFDSAGNPKLNKKGEQETIPASTWLDQNKPVEQMTWVPGEPMLIRNRLVSHGGWISEPNVTCFNLYLPPTITPGNAAEADPWLDHISRIYPNDADHIVCWLAHRAQRPADKINHALVLGGPQGIGKDSLLEPVKQTIGPWNFSEVSPAHMLGRFNGFLKSVILRVNEARDLGDVNRYQFYDHMKAYTAAPPDVLRVDEKNLREHSVINCCGVVITSNHKSDGIYLPADDRRHYVAWSDLTKDDFPAGYWKSLWGWYAQGGFRHVAAYLAELDISGFDPKAPPPKTSAFWAIVDASRAPEDAELQDVLDKLGNPDATTIARIAYTASGNFQEWVNDRKNRRVIPHRMESCGYVPVRNPDSQQGLWQVHGTRQAVYAKNSLSVRDQLRAAAKLIKGEA